MSSDTPDYDDHSFEDEARERLASVETRQESIENRIDGLYEGQQDIAAKIDGLAYVEEERFDNLQQTVKENEESRIKTKGVVTFIVVSLSLGGGVGAGLGAILALM